MATIKRVKIAIIVLILSYVILDVTKHYIVYSHFLLATRKQNLQDLPSKNVKNVISEIENFTKNQISANSAKGIRTTTTSRTETPLLSKLSQKPLASITNLTQSKRLVRKSAVSTKSKSNCEFWKYPYRVEFNGSSFLTLDPKRFLYPALIWGPNNQINGLQQAVYLAIKLNR